jgi:hypothetical protein
VERLLALFGHQHAARDQQVAGRGAAAEDLRAGEAVAAGDRPERAVAREPVGRARADEHEFLLRHPPGQTLRRLAVSPAPDRRRHQVLVHRRGQGRGRAGVGQDTDRVRDRGLARTAAAQRGQDPGREEAHLAQGVVGLGDEGALGVVPGGGLPEAGAERLGESGPGRDRRGDGEGGGETNQGRAPREGPPSLSARPRPESRMASRLVAARGSVRQSGFTRRSCGWARLAASNGNSAGVSPHEAAARTGLRDREAFGLDTRLPCDAPLGHVHRRRRGRRDLAPAPWRGDDAAQGDRSRRGVDQRGRRDSVHGGRTRRRSSRRGTVEPWATRVPAPSRPLVIRAGAAR